MRISVAFSIHRPEVIPLCEPGMRSHRAVCLEEPETPGFLDMLEGRMSIDDYLMGTDFEYPQFSVLMCELLQTLHQEGKPILQVDPYMDVLAGIHERFAAGEGPDDIEPGTLQRAVYERERLWSGALLDFYQKSMSPDFRNLVEAVKFFGKADAARGRLRDDLRAQTLAELAQKYDSLYVEAGYIHTYLLTALRRRAPQGAKIKPLYLLEPLVRELTGERQPMGPGDVLTITYTYKPEYTGHKADLQAARSLVRIKILRKEEYPDGHEDFPHTRDEVEASRLVRALDFAECETLYGRIRSMKTADAKNLVSEFVAKK